MAIGPKCLNIELTCPWICILLNVYVLIKLSELGRRDNKRFLRFIVFNLQ
jgi:hypothetical protein